MSVLLKPGMTAPQFTDEEIAAGCLIAARLIAAAPEMLAVLKESTRCAAISDEWLAPIRAVIAKAEGAS